MVATLDRRWLNVDNTNDKTFIIVFLHFDLFFEVALFEGFVFKKLFKKSNWKK